MYEPDRNPFSAKPFHSGLSTRGMALAALFSVLTGVGANVRIPFPMVPLTLQTVFVLMAGLLLGPGRAALSMFLYMLLGLLGLPFFSGGGGIQSVLTPSFGFVVGFIPASWAVGRVLQMSGYAHEKAGLRLAALRVVACLVGIAIYDLVGVFWLYVNLNWIVGKEVSFLQTLGIGLFPFLIPDLIKLAGVVLLVSLAGRRIGLLTSFRR